MMRTLFTLGFGAVVAVAFVFYVLALFSAFVFVTIGQFVLWLTGDGLPITLGAAVLVISALIITRVRAMR